MALSYNATIKLYLSLLNNSLGSDVGQMLLANSVLPTSPFAAVDVSLTAGASFTGVKIQSGASCVIMVPNSSNVGTVVIAGNAGDVGFTVSATQPVMWFATAEFYLKSSSNQSYTIWMA